MADNSRKVVDEYPPDGWLRGYFVLNDDDKIRGQHGATSAWKNSDFLRIKDLALHLLSPHPGMRILDVGCADGAMMVYCGLQGATVHGVDLGADAVCKANENLSKFGLSGEAQCRDAADTGFPDGYFDAVISSDFFEHIDDDAKVAVLREMRRVLKPGCRAVIKTPNLHYLSLSVLQKSTGRNDVEESIELRDPTYPGHG